jgi:protein-disulfide isomerase/uncharacterized membrane protein
MKMTDQNKKSTGLRLGTGLILLFSMIGLADSLYLLIAHLSHGSGGALTGLCHINEQLNCASAIESGYSKVAGIPVPVFSFVFYFVTAVIAGRKATRLGEKSHWDLLYLLYFTGLIYAVFLLYHLLFTLDAVCPACLLNDAILLCGFIVAALCVQGGPAEPIRQLLKNTSGLMNSLPFKPALIATCLGLAIILFYWLNYPVPHGEDASLDAVQEHIINFPTRYEIPNSDWAPTKGPEDATVHIIEFSDFECPYCDRFRQTLEQILEAYPEDVRLSFMHYPLSNTCNSHVQGDGHTRACGAAKAAICADEQDYFWPMHDLLFDNQSDLDMDSLVALANQLNLNMDQFRTCINAPQTRARLENNIDAAWSVMVEQANAQLGTPFFFVNGMPLLGNLPYATIETLVREELEREDTPDEAPE